ARDLDQAGLYDAFTGKWVMKSWLPRLMLGQAKEQGVKLRNGIENGIWAKKDDEASEAAIAPFHDRLVALAEREAAMGPDEPGRDFRTRRMLSRRLPLVGTLSTLRQAHQEVQRDENVRTLGTLNRMISEVIRDNPAPYIFERTGERYDHIFIDEFQDTSVTQWHNLAVAVGETLGHGKLSLVVGDAKQAIYRWRNGDHRQLGALPALVLDDGAPLSPALQDAAGRMGDVIERVPIVQNWRSAPQVVDFNNRVFRALSSDLEPSLADVYGDVEQTPMKAFPGGVEVEVLVEETADDRFEAVCVWMEARIRQAMADGFAAGDIAVLVRKNKEAKRIAEYLLSRPDQIVPFTDESLALGRHPASLAVVHLLEAMEDPREAGPVLRFLQALGAIR
ncbi:MAG: UvrD-helicase domain-containing protein, partial [Flavobacteriales bacterium]